MSPMQLVSFRNKPLAQPTAAAQVVPFAAARVPRNAVGVERVRRIGDSRGLRLQIIGGARVRAFGTVTR